MDKRGYSKRKIEGKVNEPPSSVSNMLILQTPGGVSAFIVNMISEDQNKPVNPYLDKKSNLSGDVYYHENFFQDTNSKRERYMVG